MSDAELTIKQLIETLWDAKRSITTLNEFIDTELRSREPDIHKYDGYLQNVYLKYDYFKELKEKIPVSWFINPTKQERFKDRLGALFYDVGQLKKFKITDIETFKELSKDLKKIDSDTYDAILIADKIKEVPVKTEDQESTEPGKAKPKRSWKEQLNDAAIKLLESEENPRNLFDDEDAASDQIIKSLAAQKPRLLKVDEPFGLVVAPIICGKSYVSKFGWKLLQRPPLNLQMEFVHGNYLLIKNAWLIGYAERLINDLNLSVDSIPHTIHKKLIELGNKDLKNLSMIGPAQSRGPHHYLVLMPGSLMNNSDVSIYQWDFLPGTMTDAPKSEIDDVSEDEIAKELPTVKQYLPEG